MARWIWILMVVVGSGWAGCGSSYTYRSYEVIHRVDLLKPGDEVRVVPVNGAPFRGSLLSKTELVAVVATEGGGERAIAWTDIRVVERVVKAVAR
ncbi:MAG: hypothetical protein QGI83_18365 [Candidatus Latescibacteria bacterium]|jgi:hypothetical protein|nr:hypothetical protein [Candidatus Latescibacterota bacterium]